MAIPNKSRIAAAAATHLVASTKKSGGVGERWREDTCTEGSGPTDAFGEIIFTGGKIAKYLRMDKFSSTEAVRALLLDVWDLPYPNLIVSVTGGAKKLHLSGQLKDVVKKGLINSVHSTGGWIITGGASEGVTKLAGNAVREYSSCTSRPITCLGIAPWGCVANRSQLVQCSDQPIAYRHSYRLQPQTCNLEVNHSHFLLIDNGTQLKFGAETDARMRIEEALSQLRIDSSSEANRVPLVCVAVQGGFDTYEAAKCTVENGNPLVLIKGSGGAADLMAYAYQYSEATKCVDFDEEGNEVVRIERLLTREQIVSVTERLRAEFDEFQVPQVVDWIEAVLKFDHLITVYEMEGDESSSALDVAILEAVMRANSRREDQLRLALTMNRVDIARNFIFGNDSEWSTHDLEPFMYKALVLDRPEFVKLFLENNFMMHEFLSIEKMFFLYNTLYPDTRVKEFVWKVFMNKRDKGKRYFSLEDVGEVLEEVAGRFFQSPYLDDPRYIGLCPDTIIRPDEPSPTFDPNTKEKVSILRNARSKVFIHGYRRFNKTTSERNASLPHFDDPYNDLFVWCLLTGRVEMARLLWNRVSEPLAAALTAHLVWTRIAKRIKANARERDQLLQSASEFEQLAIGLSQETSSRDSVKSELLLIRVSEFFGGSTPLQLASYGGSQEFFGEEAPQSLLDNVWNGGLSTENCSLKLFIYVLLTVLCFPAYIFGVLKGTLFVEEARHRRQSQLDWIDDDQDIEEIYIRKSGSRSIRKLETGLAEENIIFLTAGRKMKWYNKLVTFHTAPRVIFMYNFLFYLIFLVLYGYALMTEFNPTIHISEILLMIWIGSLVAEEVRQALFINRHTFREKLIEYVTDLWNVMDMTILVIFLLAIVLRVIPNETTLNAGRILYSLDIMLFFFRILHFFTVNKVLGPYIVMIGHMVEHLFYFLIVLIVLISGYGIAQQAILFPNSFKEAGLIKDIYQRAYFQLFGLLSLDQMQGELSCTFDEDMWSNNTMPRCSSPEGTWVSPILLAIYLILAYMLMFSLLIAAFASTYSRMMTHTAERWRFMRMNMVREFSEKPCLPPPFILISLIYQLIRVLCKRCYRCSKQRCGCSYSTRSPLQHKFSPGVDARLKNWETSHVTLLQMRLRETKANNNDTVLRDCVQRVGNLNQQLQQLAARVEELNNGKGGSEKQQQQQQLPPPPPPPRTDAPPQAARIPQELNSRIERLEAKFDSTSKSLGAVLSAVQSFKPGDQSRHSRRSQERELQRDGTQPSFSISGSGSSSSKQNAARRKMLTSPYPGTDVNRQPVSESQIAWAVTVDDYSPPEINLECQGVADPSDTNGLNFNAMDTAHSCDRRSHSGEYSISNGKPLNPLGRSGLSGRGALNRWGPNHRVSLAITRWARESDGSVTQKRGRKVLEIQILQTAAGYRLPEFRIEGLEFNAKLQQILQLPGCPLTFDLAKDAVEENEALQQLLEAGGELMTSGIRDDPLNTDNAWIEAVARNLHDEQDKLWRKVKIRLDPSLGKNKWTELSHKAEEKFVGSDWPTVEKVIQLRNAYY